MSALANDTNPRPEAGYDARSFAECARRWLTVTPLQAATGPYLCVRVKKTDSGKCWWCDSSERQSRHHLFASCKAWTPQRDKMWRDIGKARK